MLERGKNKKEIVLVSPLIYIFESDYELLSAHITASLKVEPVDNA